MKKVWDADTRKAWDDMTLEEKTEEGRKGNGARWWLIEGSAALPSFLLVAFWCLVLGGMAILCLLAIVKAVTGT